MEFYSHNKPKKYLLKEHLLSVAKRSKAIVLSKDFAFIDKNILANVSFLIGASHDFGKYTTFFQKKLNGFKIEDEYLSNHSFLSAIFGFELVKGYLSKINLIDHSPYKYFPMLSYFVIKHHHGNLNNIEDDINREKIFESFKRVNKQVQDIYKNKDKILSDYEIFHDIDNNLFVNTLNNLEKYNTPINHSDEISNLISELEETFYRFNLENSGTTSYFLTLFLYSVLIDSDKKHAGNVREIKRKNLPENLVDVYLNSHRFKEKNKSKLNELRQKIYKSVTTNIIKDENLSRKIFTITAPTGTGKTLTSLSAAIKLRSRLKKHFHIKNEFRIIYALPFTSIIDQSYTVFEEVLSYLKNYKGYESEFLLKHHYLSEIIYITKETNPNTTNEEIEIDESLALIESWESEIVVTTFIQFFYAIIGYKNKNLKKFHNIVNSIIILDEVQNIPIKYWSLVNIVLRNFAELFNTRIILMTATKPLIFENEEYVELVENYENYFKFNELNRVKINIKKEKEILSEFANNIELNKHNSYLFVFNTINATYDFYQIIKGEIDNDSEKLVYLSTNITPKERKYRINCIKRIISEINQHKSKFQRIIIISTQLIEAGVDIDCDCVYRDIGPLDSIIQVAGRCNRNKRLNLADMHLVSLLNEQGKSFSNFIYDPEFIFVLDELLKNRKIVYEKEFLNIINQYFILVKQKVAGAEDIIKSITKLQFDKKSDGNNKFPTISTFKLIEKEYLTIDIFIELNQNAKKVWQKYKEIRNNSNLTGLEKRNEFLKIRKDFNDYIISVPEKYSPPGFEKDIINPVPNDQLHLYYDKETGIKRETAGSGIYNPFR